MRKLFINAFAISSKRGGGSMNMPLRESYSSIGWSRDSHAVHDLGSLIRRFGTRPETTDLDAIEANVRQVLVEKF